MKIQKIVTNIEVTRHSRFSDYAVSCEYAGARYHVWVDRETRQIQAGGNALGITYHTLFKNPLRGVDRKSPEHFRTRKLDADSQWNAEIVRQMMDYANHNKLFDKADEVIWQQELTDEEQSRKNRRRKQIEERAVDLFQSLQDIFPLAEAYLANAPSHPDNAKLESARALLTEIRRCEPIPL